MRISKNQTKVLKCIIITALVLIARPLHDSGRTLSDSTVDMFHFSGRTIVCGIELGDDMKTGHGLETGFAYEMMQDFARDLNCNVIIVTGKNKNYLDSLRQGSIDLLFMHHEAVTGEEDILLSNHIIECSAMAITADKDSHMQEINEWLGTYTASEEFKEQKDLFFRPMNPIKRAKRGVKVNKISPYDDLLKKYAKELGWDWRMLAAVVYQESKFSISSRSHRGATGLMQVMPQTGAYYNIHDLVDPEQNLIAGTRHLKRLQQIYSKCNMSSEERIRFTLAAYNAGEGRIKDCRNMARSQNLNENEWENIVSIIPLMNEDSILEDENVKLGKFKGTETIAYVKSVTSLYNAICKICPR